MAPSKSGSSSSSSNAADDDDVGDGGRLGRESPPPPPTFRVGALVWVAADRSDLAQDEVGVVVGTAVDWHDPHEEGRDVKGGGVLVKLKISNVRGVFPLARVRPYVAEDGGTDGGGDDDGAAAVSTPVPTGKRRQRPARGLRKTTSSSSFEPPKARNVTPSPVPEASAAAETDGGGAVEETTRKSARTRQAVNGSSRTTAAAATTTTAAGVPPTKGPRSKHFSPTPKGAAAAEEGPRVGRHSDGGSDQDDDGEEESPLDDDDDDDESEEEPDVPLSSLKRGASRRAPSAAAGAAARTKRVPSGPAPAAPAAKRKSAKSNDGDDNNNNNSSRLLMASETDSDDEKDRPFRVEYATSGRSACRCCDDQIQKGVLRVSSCPLFRGKPGFTVYRHLQCQVFPDTIQRMEDVGGWRRLTGPDRDLLQHQVDESRRRQEQENEELDADELVQTAFQGELRVAPVGLAATLLPFQVEGVSWMYNQEHTEAIRGGILADEMGMGKTLQTITTILDNRPKLQHCTPGVKHPPSAPDLAERQREEALWEETRQSCHYDLKMANVPEGALKVKKAKGVAPIGVRAGTLVCCPVIALYQWREEIEKFTTQNALSVCIYHGNDRSAKFPREVLAKYDIVLTTYQVLEMDFRKMVSPNKVKCPNCGRAFKVSP
jgi:hypothetical protein